MKNCILLLPLTLGMMTACSIARKADMKNTSESAYAIKNVTIVDVENGNTIPGQTVILYGDRIDQIGEQGKIDIPQGVKIIAGDGLYLMPGLVDAHVHYFDAPIFGRLMLANGVLLVRDTGMPNDFILNIKDELKRGKMPGPELITTGVILDGNPPIIPTISLGMQTPEQGREAVRQQAEAGVDMIKTYSKLDKEVFLAILDEAHKHHLKVVAHLPESIYLEDAAAAGLDSSEHFNGFEKVIANLLGEPVKLTFSGQASEAHYFQRLGEVDPKDLQEVYQRLYESGITICPTVVTFKTLTNIKSIQTRNFPRSEYISQSVMDLWKQLWAQQDNLPDFIWRNWAKMVYGLNRAGVPLMIGTDLMLPGIIPGYSVHEEMVIWQEAGIPRADILRSGTIVPAQFMGLGDRLGSVSVGKTASIILLRANPLEDIRNTQQIESVFLSGQYFSREDLDQLLNEAMNLAQQPNNP